MSLTKMLAVVSGEASKLEDEKTMYQNVVGKINDILWPQGLKETPKDTEIIEEVQRLKSLDVNIGPAVVEGDK